MVSRVAKVSTPTSVRGTSDPPMNFQHHPSHHRGFTLIEVMVVLLIMSVAAAAVSLGLGSLHGRDEARALERLRRVLEATAERAMVRGEPLAIEFLADGYRFWAKGEDGNWRSLIDPPVFTERVLPEGAVWGNLARNGQAAASGVGQRLAFGVRAPEYELQVGTPQGTARYTGLLSGEVRLDLAGR